MEGYGRAKKFFNANAEKYSQSRSHAEDSDLDILIESLNLNSNMKGLDVGTGTGFTGLRLARKIDIVYAMDIAENMLKETSKLADKYGVQNIVTIKGSAESMPFDDSNFDIITSRRAPHHFLDKAKFIDESYRTLKSGGMIGIDDMTCDQNYINYLNRLENIRDNSHMAAESPEGWIKLLKDAGFYDIKYHIYERRISFAQWIYPVRENSIEGLDSYNYIINSGPFRDYIKWENNTFLKKWIIITGKKP
ncbi:MULTISPECIES: methyltransferase domain-containing protein [Acidiplasma]|uniref:Methyltransferase domain-containing protein n=1 Tax=Acidiplasma aeolicum TaxID=507754 RepID=A0A0Q0RR01_9ARCH|nr:MULTISPECIES: methyltransferase domain-containing protein [Acidiplasma]KQB34790.1 hypothetical protein AOG54_00765 [Acidiplasma aeolicum]